LKVKPTALWQDLLEAKNAGAEIARSYPVHDPYGAKRAAKIISEHFQCALPPDETCLTFGAGITSLLYLLSHIVDRGIALSSPFALPDFSVWVIANGGKVHSLEVAPSVDKLLADLVSIQPALVHLERPSLFGEVLPLEILEKVAQVAAEVGTIILVDEAYASYLDPLSSAVTLVHRLSNLVVLRSLSKGYSWGGLRVGFALASQNISTRVRELVPPLQISELAYLMALKLLTAGDIFEPLRARINVAKPATIAMLEALGLQVIAGHSALPQVLIHDEGRAASELLSHHGVLCKRLEGIPIHLARVAIPLSEERLSLCGKLLDKENTR
jgi:histidinol-phosphate/aromatic aminotransferase/cobyric acid decarboxylase-like protein